MTSKSKKNYQNELDKIIAFNELNNLRPRLLLHACCAPCSSYCLEYLCKYFGITIFYYNPNITDADEYEHRAKEEARLIEALNQRYNADIKLIVGAYDKELFYKAVKGFEDCKEGGERCRICFALRLDESGRIAKEKGFDYFTTTLTISPLKNADILNDIGNDIAGKYGIEFLPSDFKKRNGYKRSIELSAEYNLYRQNYCGCEFSKRDAVKINNEQ